MKLSHSIPLTVVAVVGLAAAALVIAAIFITDGGEERLNLQRRLGLSTSTSVATLPSGSNSALELQGRWLGMSLAAADSASARGVGVQEGESGVVVIDLAAQGSERARAAGVVPGDSITAIDGKPVRNMTDLYNVTRTVNSATPTILNVKRGNLPMSLVVPAAQAATVQAATRGEAPEGAGAPAAALPAAWAGGQFYCPREGLIFPPGRAGPGLRCPRCLGPLQPYRSYPGPSQPYPPPLNQPSRPWP